MASTRLNQNQRRKIAQKLIGDRFDKRREAIKKCEHKLALDVYRDVISEKDRRRMSRLPKGWMRTRNDLRCVFGGTYAYIDLPEEKPMPESRLSGALANYDARHDLAVRFRKMRAEQEAIGEEERQMNREIWSVLNSATTDKKLIEVWPAIEKVVREVVSTPPTVNLPAVNLKSLNEKLGVS